MSDYLATHGHLLGGRDRSQDELGSQLFHQGATDAAFAELPKRTEAAYLEGYIHKIKTLDRDPKTGEVLYRSKAFRDGAYDDPNPRYSDDF